MTELLAYAFLYATRSAQTVAYKRSTQQSSYVSVSTTQKKFSMAKIKKKLTAKQRQAKREAKAERQKKYTWVFMGGKQVRIKRPAMVEGVPADQYVSENADPIWLHQNGMCEEACSSENDEDNVFI